MAGSYYRLGGVVSLLLPVADCLHAAGDHLPQRGQAHELGVLRVTLASDHEARLPSPREASQGTPQ